METYIIVAIMCFVIGVEAAIPYLVKRTVVFGVSIPDAHIRDSRLLSFKRKYSASVVGVSALVMAAYILWAVKTNPEEETAVLAGLAIQFGIIFFSTALYFYLHAKTMQLKKDQKWGAGLKPVKVTDLAVRTQDAMLPWPVFVLPMIVTVGWIAYTMTQYGSLPQQIPMHWGADGKPDAFTDKNPFSANALLFVLLTMQFMFLGINEATKRSGIKLSATRTEASRARQLTLRKYSSWFMFLVSVLVTMLFSFLQLTTIFPNMLNGTMTMAIPLIFLFTVLAGTIIFAVKVGNAGEKEDAYSENGIKDVDEDQYWKGGLLYFNRNDPSMFVEKRFGVGWTLNFANPFGYILVFAPIILILLIAFLS